MICSEFLGLDRSRHGTVDIKFVINFGAGRLFLYKSVPHQFLQLQTETLQDERQRPWQKPIFGKKSSWRVKRGRVFRVDPVCR
ncbi:hypothetical protein CDAR_472291 [Caerostris darwini]|uniref:Uncharacterized protein n=1 Tax=Caerostris darwini TaxID=1538125 RepID=A0AAV4VL28_9ARAC|nr:hypothetical protein CDAR_472291 [Caerostris darwini]